MLIFGMIVQLWQIQGGLYSQCLFCSSIQLAVLSLIEVRLIINKVELDNILSVFTNSQNKNKWTLKLNPCFLFSSFL